MKDQKGGADTAKFKMKPRPGSPPGLETDGQGNIVPLAQRTAEDRSAARGERDAPAGTGKAANPAKPR